MSEEKLEDVRDIAVKLNTIRSQSPTDYAYLKGWIHCLLLVKENPTTMRVCGTSEVMKGLKKYLQHK